MRVEPPLNLNVTLCSPLNVHVTVPPGVTATLLRDKYIAMGTHGRPGREGPE